MSGALLFDLDGTLTDPRVGMVRSIRFALDRLARACPLGVYGAELDGRFDDKAVLLAHLLTTEGVAPETAVMVGDRASDVVAARTNGIRSIGVLWGYGSEQELVGAGPEALCASPDEVAPRLSRLPPLRVPPATR